MHRNKLQPQLQRLLDSFKPTALFPFTVDDQPCCRSTLSGTQLDALVGKLLWLKENDLCLENHSVAPHSSGSATVLRRSLPATALPYFLISTGCKCFERQTRNERF